MFYSPTNVIANFSTIISESAPAGSEVFTMPFGLALILFSTLLLILALALIWNARNYQIPESLISEHQHAHESGPQDSSPQPDDLTVIEGIGPKTAAAFHAAGITTYEQLAGLDPAHLDQVLDDSGLRLGDPSTWPEQANLASQGDWQGLEELQANLNRGRREAE
jgi:predicted flap endonuclease-1-like 5' DNA nuclease